jgi:hypothetical protein
MRDDLSLCVIEQLEQRNAFSSLGTILQGAFDREVAIWACYAVANLACAERANLNLGLWGACEAVLDILLRFGDEDEDGEVAYWCCVAVSRLAYNNPHNRGHLVRSGRCFAVVDALERSI